MLVWAKRNYGMWKLHEYDPQNLREGQSVEALLDQAANAFSKALLRCPSIDQSTVNDLQRSMDFVLNDYPGLSATVITPCNRGLEVTVLGPNIMVSICNLSPSEYARRVR